MKTVSKEERILLIASAASFAFGVLKGLAFFGTGSFIVLASFFDSLTDGVISFANSRIHRAARAKADPEHPFGHGGFEVLAALIQAFVIGFFCLILISQAVQRILLSANSDSISIENIPYAAATLILSSAFAYGIHRFYRAKLKEQKMSGTRSLAVLADHAHYAGDAQLNGAAAIGLLLVWWTGYEILDSLMGIAGAGLAVWAVLPSLKASIADIMHVHAGDELDLEIEREVLRTDPLILGMHRLRTRRMGPALFIDFHLKLKSSMALELAHNLGEKVTGNLRQKYANADVIIHLDPDSEPDDDHWPRPGP